MLPDVVLHLVSWASNLGFYLWNMDLSKTTELNYAFANIVNGQVTVGDPNGDILNYISPPINLPLPSLVSQTSSFPIGGPVLQGQFRQLFEMKQRYRHLRTNIVIGGYTWSAQFPTVAATQEARFLFVTSAVNFINTYGFDGVTLDWEFPVLGGMYGPGMPSDAQNFVDLLKEFRAQFSTLSFRPRLSISAPCMMAGMSKLLLSDMAPLVDTFHLMCYDLAGSWSPYVEHQAPLYGTGASQDSVEKAVGYFLSQGVKPEQLVIGLPMYSRSFQNTQGLYQPFQNSWGGADVRRYVDLPHGQATEQYDAERGAAYSYDPATREFLSYDTPQSVQAKGAYVLSKGLSGLSAWESSQDTTDNSLSMYSLHQAMAKSLWQDQVLQAGVNVLQNNLCYPSSPFSNVAGYC